MELDKPRVYADLNGGWRQGDHYTLTLDSSATERDLQRLGLTLVSGLTVDFWSDDGDDEGNPDPLLFQGVVEFDQARQKWVAVTRWHDFKHASDDKTASLKPYQEPVAA